MAARKSTLKPLFSECLECGKGFDAPKIGRFCCKACGDKHRNKFPVSKERSCEQCGKAYRPKAGNRLRFCSRECSFANLKQNPSRYPTIAATLNRNEERAISSGHLRWLSKWRACAACKAPMYAMGAERVCSDECRRQRARDAAKAHHKAKYRLQSYEVACRLCLCRFTPARNAARRKYCDACRHKIQRWNRKHTRKARMRGLAYQAISPLKVFIRDGYRCGICGRKTDRKKQVPHPKAPTLDHIIPMSKGGPHLYGNVQCACFGCNSRAGNRRAGKQLLLLSTPAGGVKSLGANMTGTIRPLTHFLAKIGCL